MRIPRISLTVALAFASLLTWLTQSTVVTATTCASYDTVQVQLKWLSQAQFAGYMVAVEKGFYREQCLEAYIRPGGFNINMEEEVIQQRAQFGIDWLSSMLTQREAGYDVVLISQVFARSGNEEITMKNKNIRVPSDLKNKNVCVWLGGNELSLRALFDANSLKWDNDTSLNRWSGSDANIVAQAFSETEFLNGDCDAAAATRYNELALVLESTNAQGELYTEDDLFVFDYNSFNLSTYEDGIFASRDWLAQPGNRDIAVRFLRASMKGWLYARDYPSDVNTKIFNSDVHQDWMNNEISKLIFPTWPDGFGVAPPENLQESADRAFRYNVLQHRANVSDFYRSDIAIEAQQGYLGLLTGVAATPGWAASPDDNIYGSQDVHGDSYVARKLRFCYNNDVLALCEGTRTPDSRDILATDSSAGIALQVLAAVALLLIAVVTCGLFYYRHEKNIVAASLPFCLTICLGAAIFIASVFLSVGDANTNLCHTRLWFLGVGFCMMMGAFLIKVRRIDLIFNNKSMVTQKLPNDLLFQQLAIILAIEVLFLALFSGLSGYEVQTWNDPTSGKLTHTRCQIQHATPGSVMIGFLFGYKAIILLWCISLAYKTRDVASQFNESSWLALATYNLTFISVIVVPIVFFLGLTPNAQLIVSNIGVIVAVTLSFGLLFIPKLIFCYSGVTIDPGQTQLHRTYSGTGTTTGTTNQQKTSKEGKILAGSPSSRNGNGRVNSGDPGSPRNDSYVGGPSLQQALAASPRESTSALNWQRGLKSLSRDGLLAHLRNFRTQEAQVRAELRNKGLTDDEISNALNDDLASMTKIKINSATTSPRTNLNLPRPSISASPIPDRVAGLNDIAIEMQGPNRSQEGDVPVVRSAQLPPTIIIHSEPQTPSSPVTSTIVQTIATNNNRKLRVHYTPGTTPASSSLDVSQA